MAKAFNKPLSHGNGAGPHNIALQAGLANGSLVEYHFHKWMAYNAIFKSVPQPVDGYLEVSQEPGCGLEPKDGLIKEFSVRSEEHTSELQSLMRISYAVFGLKKKKQTT